MKHFRSLPSNYQLAIVNTAIAVASIISMVFAVSLTAKGAWFFCFAFSLWWGVVMNTLKPNEGGIKLVVWTAILQSMAIAGGLLAPWLVSNRGQDLPAIIMLYIGGGIFSVWAMFIAYRFIQKNKKLSS
jgi:hypothetical protein